MERDRIAVLERDNCSLLLYFDPALLNGSTTFEFAMMSKKRCPAKPVDDVEEEDVYITLGSTLTNTTIKKKNLTQDYLYSFRVRLLSGIEFFCLNLSVLSATTNQMLSPIISAKDSESITITWNEASSTASGYRIRIRGEGDWIIIDKLIKGLTIRKKGLVASLKYCFSVLPVFDGEGGGGGGGGSGRGGEEDIISTHSLRPIGSGLLLLYLLR